MRRIPDRLLYRTLEAWPEEAERDRVHRQLKLESHPDLERAGRKGFVQAFSTLARMQGCDYADTSVAASVLEDLHPSLPFLRAVAANDVEQMAAAFGPEMFSRARRRDERRRLRAYRRSHACHFEQMNLVCYCDERR